MKPDANDRNVHAELQELRMARDALEARNGELEDQLAKAEQALAGAENIIRAKEEFLATLAHELRTPLASVLMHAQLLRRGELDSVGLGKTLLAIERGTARQVQLLEDLLDASRIASDELKLETQAFDLCSVVRAAIESVSELGRKKAVVLEANLDESIGQVWGDPGKVEKVVCKLLTNAIQFTPAGGHVVLELAIDDGNARLCVRDNGVGIGPELLPHIFDRLVQVDRKLPRQHGGLGLGLAIVRHIVELLGGTVSAESQGLGQGATFTVTFPLTGSGRQVRGWNRYEDEPRVHPLDLPGRSHDYHELRDLRVLIVDDDPSTLEAIVAVLKLSGADVRAATSAAEARRLLDSFGPRVLVCDVSMPGEDGYVFIRKLRARDAERGGDVLALALTALAGEEDRRRALDAGFHSHMAKPVDVDRLRDAVVHLLRAS
jgi:signal transduction histidine kinase/CheY-like chemotaxis protein